MIGMLAIPFRNRIRWFCPVILQSIPECPWLIAYVIER